MSTNSPQTLLAQRKSLFWRIHFWSALIASPFALVAAFTGILYIFSPQVEDYLHGHLDNVTVAGKRLPLDASVDAALAAAPVGYKLRNVVPAFDATDSVKVYLAPTDRAMEKAGAEHSGHNAGGATKSTAATPSANPENMTAKAARASGNERISRNQIVYVNPYTAQVLGSHGEMDRFSMWSKRLHSSLLQGDGWRWMIELAASWLMVMLLTGVYLWWPRSSTLSITQTALLAGVTGRLRWKKWHATAGVVLSIMSLTILTTGLTWSKFSGEQIRSFRDATGQAPPSVPRNIKSANAGDQKTMTWQAAWDATKAQAPAVSVQLTAPRTADGVWRAVNFDRGQPDKRFDLLLDAYSGKSLYFSGWDKQTAFGKATAIGIPFHRGEFGWWNQALLLVFGLGILFSLVSGWIMFFKRPRQNFLGLPRLLPGAWRATPIGAVVTGVLLCIAMPLLAASAAVVALVEILLAWRSSGRLGYTA